MCTFLWKYKNCSYVTVSTLSSRVFDLMRCADGFTFPLTCQSEKQSELNAWLWLCVCLPFYPGRGPGLFAEQRIEGVEISNVVLGQVAV